VKYDPAKHHRRSIRLKEYDYTQAGAYFVTVCTQGQACLFGEVVDGEMRVNYAGRMVIAEWEMLPKRFPNVVLDAFVVMPNHVHGILVITDAIPVGAGSPCPYRITAQTPAGVETPAGAQTANRIGRDRIGRGDRAPTGTNVGECGCLFQIPNDEGN
jgi:hypothetical protein